MSHMFSWWNVQWFQMLISCIILYPGAQTIVLFWHYCCFEMKSIISEIHSVRPLCMSHRIFGAQGIDDTEANCKKELLCGHHLVLFLYCNGLACTENQCLVLATCREAPVNKCHFIRKLYHSMGSMVMGLRNFSRILVIRT